VRRKRTGVGDGRACPECFQGGIAQTPRVPLASFRKLYDFLGNCVSGRGNEPFRMVEDHEGHLESDAQATGRLGVKPVALQVVSDRHARYARLTERELS
jgi:hypothetical protein